MKAKSPIFSLFLALAAALSACGGSTAQTPLKPFQVSLRATSDESQPLQGVAFMARGTTIGSTNAQGVYDGTLQGAEGQVLSVVANCPEGYVAPAEPMQLRLTEVRRVNQVSAAALELEVVCTRRLRDVIVVVRTKEAPPLPVEIDGKVVAETDEYGIAHFRTQIDREVHSLSVSLGTSGVPRLRPSTPSRVFELEGQDALLLFEQSFAKEERAAPRRRLPKPVAQVEKRHVPERIESGRNHGY